MVVAQEEDIPDQVALVHQGVLPLTALPQVVDPLVLLGEVVGSILVNLDMTCFLNALIQATVLLIMVAIRVTGMLITKMRAEFMTRLILRPTICAAGAMEEINLILIPIVLTLMVLG